MLRDRLVAFRQILVALRFELGQHRFALGAFFRERETCRTLPGTFVRTRSNEFGSPATEGAASLAAYVSNRFYETKICAEN